MCCHLSNRFRYVAESAHALVYNLETANNSEYGYSNVSCNKQSKKNLTGKENTLQKSDNIKLKLNMQIRQLTAEQVLSHEAQQATPWYISLFRNMHLEEVNPKYL